MLSDVSSEGFFSCIPVSTSQHSYPMTIERLDILSASGELGALINNGWARFNLADMVRVKKAIGHAPTLCVLTTVGRGMRSAVCSGIRGLGDGEGRDLVSRGREQRVGFRVSGTMAEP